MATKKLTDGQRKATIAPRGGEELPDFVREYHGETGLEGLGQKDLVIPRLAICQAMSPQRQKNNPAFIPGLEEQQFFNTVTKEIYGEGPLTVTPLFVFKSRFYFRDMKEGGGIICQSPDAIHCPLEKGGPCVRGEFTTDEDGNSVPPECSLFYNYPLIVHTGGDGFVGPLVLTLKGAATKVARNWNSLMRLRKGPAFAGRYTLRAVEDTNSAGQTYYVADVANAGVVQDRSLFEALREMFEQLKGRTIVADPANLEDEVGRM